MRVIGMRLRSGGSQETARSLPDGLHRPARLFRYLPLAVLSTVSVVVLPVMLAALIVPRGGAVSMAASAVAAVSLSIVIAGVESALWKRLSRARDLTFSELMLWGWLRRCWAERGLAERRHLYESAKRIGPTVSIDQLERLSMMLEARDAYTHGHSKRVARHSARIARQMRLQAHEVAKIRTAALVHDVGKIYTPREILNNPHRLTDAEFEVIKRHAADGAEMLATVGNPDIAAMVRHHHERVDGGGYPDGLAGEQIPIGARIIAVADTFDALTSNRAYRGANTHRRALRIISSEAGNQLDEDVVAAFVSDYSSRRTVAWLALAAVAPERVIAALQGASAGVSASSGGLGSLLPALGASGLLALSPAMSGTPASSSGSAHRGGAAAVAQEAGGQAAQTQGGAGQAAQPRSAPPSQTKSRLSSHRRRASTRAKGGGGGRRRGEPGEAPPTPSSPGGVPPSLSGATKLPGAPGSGSAATAAPGAGPTAARSRPEGTSGSASGGNSSPPSSTTPGANGSTSAPEPERGAVQSVSSVVSRTASTPASTTAAAVSSTAGTVAGTAATAVSSTASTVAGTTAALGSEKPPKEATSALVSGTTETVTETTRSLLSGLTKTLSRL